MVPSTVSLTAGRLIAPLIALIAACCSISGAEAWRSAAGLAISLIATLMWFSAEVGIACVQGSAYGDEQRFPLKPPNSFYVPMTVTWAAAAGLGTWGLVNVGDRDSVVGGAALVLSCAAGWMVGPRFHQLSRRWVVIVPVGVVIHDPVLLAENALFRGSQLASLHLAAPGSQAADLSGGALGTRLEVVLHEMDTITKAGTRKAPQGTALHVLSVLVSPSRPGRVLRAAAARRLPVLAAAAQAPDEPASPSDFSGA